MIKVNLYEANHIFYVVLVNKFIEIHTILLSFRSI